LFDTVLLAIGRDIQSKDLNLDNAGVKYTKWGKIITNDADQTNVPNIFAIGDNAEGRPELTPVAIQAGNWLSKRLFGDSKKLMNYHNVVTCVFTPLEYGCVGLNEADAIEKFGDDKIDIFHTSYKPLEWNFLEDKKDDGYIKVVVHLPDDKVLGIHFLGPHAGEVIQGFSVAMNCGVTREILFDTVGLHPTCAEEICDLKQTKRENKDAKKTGC
jgi:thioredoxin reductase (NADPH)